MATSNARLIADGGGGGGAGALHGFNVNSKGQLVYTKEVIDREFTNIRTQDANGNELYEQYHLGPGSMQYFINNRGKFVVRFDLNEEFR